MARSRQATATIEDPGPELLDWYRAELAKPAPPAAQWKWPPVTIGPTWQRTDDGHWLLPELTLGWDVLLWCGSWLQHAPGKPWRFTLEQARWILWWYAVDDAGEWLYWDGVLQRLKGWGKDPLVACLAAVEMLGPCRFAGWDDDNPVAADCSEAWVIVAATALDQTKTTMRLFNRLFTAEAKARYRIQVGREIVYALGDERMIQAVTSSPTTLEGARSTFTVRNETQHWLANNDGHEMAAVIERNTTKSPQGTARALSITNAPDPSEDSVALRDRDAYEEAVALLGGADYDETSGEPLTAEAALELVDGLLYDSIEAPPEAPLTAQAVPDVIASIRGDSHWLSAKRILKSILDPRNPPSRSRRFWYNQLFAAEDAWTDPQAFNALGPPARRIVPLELGQELALFFDGSKSDDGTALIGCRISDGLVVTLGYWQRPPGDRGKDWTAPRAEIDARVETVFELYRPVVFYADPSHARDDETQERYWDGLIDEWHRRYKDRLKIWAQRSQRGAQSAHSILWDMASPARSEAFTAAAERCAFDIDDEALIHDGDRRLKLHVRNARRYPNRWGVSLWKGHRESKRKVDLAVGMVGARMARRDFLNTPKKAEKEHSGVVYY